MKYLKTLLFALVTVSFFVTTEVTAKQVLVKSDSLNIIAEASLFFEAYKIKQYEMWTIEKGFNVINNKPDFMPKYKIYKKLDNVIFEVYADSNTTEETKTVLADTALYMYDKAIKYDPEDSVYFMLKKAYVLDKWKNEPMLSIDEYEKAFAADTAMSTDEIYYAAQLGDLYEAHMADNPEYKMKALEVYLKLADLEPDNALWNAKIQKLAEDPSELEDFMKKAWDQDKENTEKAWKYAMMAKKNQDYEAEIEPLKFLISKNADVVNYWTEIASAYQKTKQTDKAIGAYKKLIDLQPNNRDSYFNLALVYKDMDQLSVARSYLQKAAKVSPGWDYPLFIEAGLYEQAARNCGFDFEDKCVYQLAVDTYQEVVRMHGEHASDAQSRVEALANSVPTKEDYFFRRKQKGDVIKIEGKCYDWIDRSIKVNF